MNPFLLVFVGGGIGSVCRYATGLIATRLFGLTFPIGTLIANLLGALIIGLITELLALKVQAPEPLRLLFVTGFLGGYTTFSSFSLEVARMVQQGDYASAIGYVLVSVLGSLILVLGTMALLRQVL